MNKAFRKLIVWQKADELAYQVYLVTKAFPRNEIFGLVSQLRRSVVSVPTNIVEGMGRQNKNELRQFINIALGSLAETEYLIDFSKRLGFITDPDYQEIDNLRKHTGALLWRFYKSL